MIPEHGSQDILIISNLFPKLKSELGVGYVDLRIICETLPLADTDLKEGKSL
jgi:hypothetical protein